MTISITPRSSLVLFSKDFPKTVPTLASLSTIAYPGIALVTNKSPFATFPNTLQGTRPCNARPITNSPCNALFIKCAGFVVTTPAAQRSPLLSQIVTSFSPPNTSTVPGS